MPSELPEKHQPLNPSERKRVIAAVEDSRAVVEVCVLFILFTGMHARWAAHVQASMVSETPMGLEITLPPGPHDCIAGRQSRHGGSTPVDWNRSIEPCAFCKDGTFEFPDPRVIPIRDDRAVSAIRDWFKLYDRLPSGVTITQFIQDVGTDVGIPRLNSICLRNSFGVLLAGKGFDQFEIAEIMGFSKSFIADDLYILPTFGRVCEGENPFVCNAETSRRSEYEKCPNTVSSRDHYQCYAHRGSQCGAEKVRGGQCERNPTESDGRCQWHTQSE